MEGSSSVLEYEKLLIGMIPPDERILLLERKRSPNFNGVIEQLDFNGNKYLEGNSQLFAKIKLARSLCTLWCRKKGMCGKRVMVAHLSYVLCLKRVMTAHL